MTDDEYQQQADALEAALRPKLTDAFLETLVHAAKTVGWSVDYTEVADFVRSCFQIAGKEAPDMTPFQQP